MIIVTGAAGFIASNLIQKLNENGFKNVIAVDDFSHESKKNNYQALTIFEFVDRNKLLEWIDKNEKTIEFVFHLGARTDTTEFDKALLRQLNTTYSQELWSRCVRYQIPMVYASSAATYGLGELGYKDDEQLIDQLKPLNPYGESKNEFDQWVLKQTEKPYFWAGLKFFNVYGPKENHKGRMASVIWHAYKQISATAEMKLFRSHNPDFMDGEQMRDFVYVNDVTEVLYWLMHHRKNSGIYNLGSGKARSFLDLVKAVFKAMEKPENISFIDTPADIRDKYQYFTEADMNKLKSIGYPHSFTELEKGVADYVNWLKTNFE